MDQSKQGQSGKEGKRKGDDEATGGNGSNGHDDIPAELAAQAKAAGEAEKQSVDKGIDAWKKIVAAAPASWAPKRELARVYKKAERWNAFIEVMKDAVDKANWASPEDKIPVLIEMIEVYRERLKLDVMVVNAFNQILNIQPTNAEAGEALAAQYETMKRWPDLISILRRKGRAVPETSEKVALHLKVANLFLEKFSNQAEAIKAYETILELDPDNAEALGFLKQMYEKRRDWEKLVGVHQREIELLSDEESRQLRRIEVAKLASGEAEEARRSRSTCGSRSSRATPRTWRRSASSRSSTSARRPGPSWATCCRSRSRWRATPRSARRCSSSSASSTRRRSRTAPRRPRPGRRSCARSPTTGARRTPSRSSTSCRRTGTPSRRSTPPRTSGTSSCACSSDRPRRTTARAASASGTRSASSTATA